MLSTFLEVRFNSPAHFVVDVQILEKAFSSPSPNLNHVPRTAYQPLKL
jgi:hypothetical protein